MDNGKVIALTLLELSTAFGTIDHIILLRRLHDWFGVTRKALDWSKSYLTGRCRGIKLGDCLISLLESLYTTPLSSMISGHGIPPHLYADDNQLYFFFASGDWMVYSHVWPLSSHGCRQINWNWTQVKLNSSLLETADNGANSSVWFPLSFSVSKLTQ